MGAYLIDHPPRVSQYGRRSSWAKDDITGLIVLHTAESVMDTVGPDTGAEAVAEFIRTRTTYGSYHDLVDSDSVVNLVPYELGAYQDGTGSNGFALSISFACRSSDWRRMSDAKRRGFLRQGARAFARQQRWLKDHGHPTTPLRLLTKAQTDRGMAGLTYHGYRDPARRTDPGVEEPDLFPFDEFVAYCRDELDGTTTPEEDDDMSAADIKAIRDDLADLKADVAKVKVAVDGDLTSLAVPGLKGTLRRFITYIDRHGYQLNRVKVPWQTRLLELLAAKAGVDVEAERQAFVPEKADD